ncbi:hypothetical protein D3C78_1025680 [compost metagenome]
MALYLTPPTAMLIASVLLGEQPALMVIVGALITVISVLTLNLERTRLVVPIGRT